MLVIDNDLAVNAWAFKINNGVNMIYGVILAAGCGSRFGEPKQFMLIDNKPLIA